MGACAETRGGSEKGSCSGPLRSIRDVCHVVYIRGPHSCSPSPPLHRQWFSEACCWVSLIMKGSGFINRRILSRALTFLSALCRMFCLEDKCKWNSPDKKQHTGQKENALHKNKTEPLALFLLVLFLRF